MGDRDLSDSEIDELLNPTKKSTYTLPGTTRRVKFDPDIRTVANWFKLPHTLSGECEIPNHDEERESRSKPRMFFVLEDGRHICRWCFVEQRDRE
jgi:hypothetical protein